MPLAKHLAIPAVTKLRLAVIVVAMSVCFSTTCLAAPRRHHHHRYYSSYSARAARYRALYELVKQQQQAVVNAAKKQYGQAAKVLAAAESRDSQAQSALNLALNEMRSANAEMKTALDHQGDLQKELAELASDILTSQPEDSPYAAARREFLAAQAEVQSLEAKLTGTSEYLARKATLAKTPGEGPAAVAQHRRDTLEADAHFRDAQARLAKSADRMSELKRELLENNVHYQAAREELVTVKKEVRTADAAVWHGSAKRAAPLAEIRSAEQAAESARRLMSQAQAVIDTYNTPAVKSASKSTR